MNSDIKPAICAGEKVLRSLKEAQNSLSEFQERGLLDALGPLSLSSSKKRMIADDAKRKMKNSIRDLEAFCKEISDLSADVDFDKNDMIKFKDEFSRNMTCDFSSDTKVMGVSKQIDKGYKIIQTVLKELKK